MHNTKAVAISKFTGDANKQHFNLFKDQLKSNVYLL